MKTYHTVLKATQLGKKNLSYTNYLIFCFKLAFFFPSDLLRFSSSEAMQSLILYAFTPGTRGTVPMYTGKFGIAKVKHWQHSVKPAHAPFASTYRTTTVLHSLTTPLVIWLTDAFPEQRTALQTGRELVSLGVQVGTRQDQLFLNKSAPKSLYPLYANAILCCAKHSTMCISTGVEEIRQNYMTFSSLYQELEKRYLREKSIWSKAC